RWRGRRRSSDATLVPAAEIAVDRALQSRMPRRTPASPPLPVPQPFLLPLPCQHPNFAGMTMLIWWLIHMLASRKGAIHGHLRALRRGAGVSGRRPLLGRRDCRADRARAAPLRREHLVGLGLARRQ